jgi:hypothetical protein
MRAAASPAQGPPAPGLPVSLRLLLALFALKWLVDVWLIHRSWPDFSWPKLGICIALPILGLGLLRRQAWAIPLAGVVCLFWLVFAAAVLVGGLLAVRELSTPFPWSNLVALPALVCVLQNLDED